MKIPDSDNLRLPIVCLVLSAVLCLGSFVFSTNSYALTLRTITDPVGNQQEWEYEESAGLLRVTRQTDLVDNKSTLRSYDANGNLVSITNPEGRVTTYTYNSHNQKIQRTEASSTPEARITTYEYLSPTIDLVTRQTVPSVFPGQVKETLTAYDADLNPTSITVNGFDPSGNPVSRTTTFTYNMIGQLLTIDGPRTDVSDITTYTYYDCNTGAECGQLQSITNAAGHITTFDAYDAGGLLITKTDANGVVTTYSYDSRYRVNQVAIQPVVGVMRSTTYEYDNAGQVIRVTAPDGTVIRNTYNAAHYLVESRDNLDNTVVYHYDRKGNRIRTETVDPDGTLVRSLATAFDHRDYVVSINDGGAVTQLYRDAAGNLTGRLDPNNNPTGINTYDSLDRLVTATDAMGGVTTYSYNVQDQAIEVIAPNGAATTYEYDDLGNRLREISPDRGVLTRVYDTAGNVVSETDARGVTVSYDYDALNRLVSVDYLGEEEDVEFTYDSIDGSNECGFGVGRLCMQVDNGGTKWLEYDEYGNAVKVSREVSGQTYVISYGYDAGDRIVSTTYPGGRVVNIDRDAVGRITSMSTTVDGETTQVVTDRTYQSDGLNTTQTLGNGITEDRSYDLQGRLTDQFTVNSMSRSYDYDSNGNILEIIDSDGPRSYSYNALDHLLGADYDSTTQGYEYDPNGNRLSLDEDGTFTPYSYVLESNRLEQVDSASINLDASGNALESMDGNQTYEYNQAGQLARVLEGGVETARYEYDVRGLRITKVTPQEATVYHYDRQGRLIAESGDGGSIRREYLYDDIQPVAMISSESDPAGPAELLSPVDGATLDTTPVVFEWEVDDSLVERVLLRVGTSEGGRDLFNSDVTGSTSRSVDIPLNGDDVYVTLHSLIEGEWTTREYVYTTSVGGTENVAILTAPVPGSTVDATPVQFQWMVDPSVVTRVLLRVGTIPGGRDLFNSDVTGGTAQNVDVPLDGNDIYVTLYSLVDGHWTTRAYAFTTVTGGVDNVAVLVSPSTSLALDTTPATFQWTVDESVVERVLLRIGTTAGARDLFNKDVSGLTSHDVDIPLDGADVHVTLYSLLDGHWTTRSYVIPTTDGGTENLAILTSPMDGTVLDTTPTLFQWTVDETLVERVLLRVGTEPGGRDLFNKDVSGSTTHLVDVPLNGNATHVTLYSLVDDEWTTRAYAFGTTGGGTDNVAVLNSPVAGTILDTTPVQFSWAVDESVVERVLLRVGTEPGGRDLFNKDVSGSTTHLVDVPLNGENVHVTLFSLVDGQWTTRAYAFGTESGGTENVAVLNNPAPGAILDTTPVQFSWAVDESVVERVLLRVGTEPGGRDLFNKDVSGSTTQLVDVPLNGSEAHVTLYSLVHGQWTTRVYTLHTESQGGQ